MQLLSFNGTEGPARFGLALHILHSFATDPHIHNCTKRHLAASIRPQLERFRLGCMDFATEYHQSFVDRAALNSSITFFYVVYLLFL